MTIRCLSGKKHVKSMAIRCLLSVKEHVKSMAIRCLSGRKHVYKNHVFVSEGTFKIHGNKVFVREETCI